ncbi:regulatory subunit of cyclin-dependent kinase [Gongronella butleri]|nr:regulatory subunit of cyclin-dependent kinase [Gongronella butleri]
MDKVAIAEQQENKAVIHGRVDKDTGRQIYYAASSMKNANSRSRSGKDSHPLSDDPEPETSEERQKRLARIKADVKAHAGKIRKSKTYRSKEYQYRHYHLPLEIAQHMPPNTLLTRKEYLMLGLTISEGWEHYNIYQPEPHIVMVRRTHAVAEAVTEAARKKHEQQRKARQERKDQALQEQPRKDPVHQERVTRAKLKQLQESPKLVADLEIREPNE